MFVRPNFSTLSCLAAMTAAGLAAMTAAGLMLIATTGIALADKVVRDHRGSNEAPQREAPKIGGPKWKGGYDTLGAPGIKGKKSGVTVRDHR